MGAAFLEFNIKGFPYSMGFDAVLSEQHDLSGEVTRHSVEKGSDITDNVIVEPEMITLEVFVSNTPITNHDLFGNVVGTYNVSVPLDVPSYDPPLAPTPGSVFNAIGSAIKSLFSDKKEYAATVLKFSRDQNYVAIAHDILWQLINDRVLVTVHTSSRTYPDMLLVRGPLTRNPPLGDACTLNLEFQSIRVVESKTATIPKEIVPTKKVDKGQQSPKEDEKRTLLRYGSDRLKGLP